MIVDWIKDQQVIINEELDKLLPAGDETPQTLHQAMRHSIFAGGKRMRPIFTIASAYACGEGDESLMTLACAVECLHTFTLIHDDLPCMDDDDFRRGHPTCHKVYGDAVAVLAGDALQSFAFELTSRFEGNSNHQATEPTKELAVATGSREVIGGQVLDLEAEGKNITEESKLREIHLKKTASLLRTSCRLGGISANATENQMKALETFGTNLGLAFQVIDDILDATQTSEKLGKTAGKDEAVGKATYPSLIGMDASRAEAKRLTEAAKNALEVFGEKAVYLNGLADYLLEREY